MKNFALIGAAGYVAPRHMQAIQETRNRLLAALDPNDSVGIIDSYFPDAHFFTEFERFDRHVEKLRRKKKKDKIDYVSICSPNYLHDAHIRFALRVNADAICEKPLVLNPWNIDALAEIEKETGNRVYNILQLRLHPSLIRLRQQVQDELTRDPGKKYSIDLTYLTSRGRWYFRSWKGDIKKSGGVATNIGIHFFDMLIWIFGDVKETIVHKNQEDTCAGILELEHAHVRWFLSVNADFLPDSQKQQNQRTYRSILVEGTEIEFSGGFTDLHTQSYQKIIEGEGFGLEEARKSIVTVHEIRNSKPVTSLSGCHSLCLES
ncbi:MAG: Gfo/Idh/MocA family oxidoreductase [Thermodesulfobacteriota bacterium]|nr:Gfo/Idh/MocA family oxidoreductase [Thermodesulfobacteriota bacterium]